MTDSASTIWSPAGRASASLEVRLLGLVDFDAALLLQERLVYEISGRNDTFGGLLLCEHPPLITIGREGSRADIRVDFDELLARQIDVRWINRGGGCVVHAPGQLAVYPLLPLDRLGMGLNDFRNRLEESATDVCRELRIPAWRDPGVPGARSRCGMFAHLGAAVKSWVSMHGMFVNVNPAPDFPGLIRSGPNGDSPTSLATARGRPTSMHAVRESLVRNLVERLGYTKYHLHTGHPLLRRTRQKVYQPVQ